MSRTPDAEGRAAGSGARGASEVQLGLALLALCTLGLVLRIVHLDIPMRYDESVTYMSYASQGWAHITSSYQNPNNHVFHSLLVGWLTGWLGNAPAIIRLPALFAGCLLIPAAAWVGYEAHGRPAGLIAAAVVATSPVLIEFSTNARGYTLLALCVLVAVGAGLRLRRAGGWLWWLAMVEAGVIGLYTIPVMAIPWTCITLWLAVGLGRQGADMPSRLRRLAPLLGANVLVAAVTVALYWGILRSQGVEALVGNRFVVADPLGTFMMDTPWALAAVVGHWARGVPMALGVLALAAVAAAVLLGRGRTPVASLFTAMVVGVALVMLVKRNWGEPRIWLWAVPLLAIAAGIGAVEVAKRIARSPDGREGATPAPAGPAEPTLVRSRRTSAPLARASLIIAGTWATAVSAWIVIDQPVRASLETGGFPEAEEVAAGIAEHYRRGDGLVTDFVSGEPLRFYLTRFAQSHELPPPAAVQRNWIVVNGADSARAHGLRSRLARMRAPPPEGSRPVFRAGEVAVYLYGRPAGSADPRLLEAVDWHTGVGGRIDEDRARTLLLEAAEGTATALASMWIAWGRAGGRAGFAHEPEEARAAAAPLLGEIETLALAGEPGAAFLMGAALDEALGTGAAPAEAAAWYRRAAEAGHVLGARALGDAYAAGRGVEPDATRAVVWWRRAAEAGDAAAQRRLGEAYAAGRGVGRDPARAAEWLRRARERGG